MKISLKNVGMLDEAEFEVGDLTIICGENNTGKTYATYSLYGFLNYLKHYIGNIFEILRRNQEKISCTEYSSIEISVDNFKSIALDIEKDLERIYNRNLFSVFAGKGSDFSNSSFKSSFIQDFINKNNKEKIDFFSRSEMFNIEITDNVFIFDCTKSKDKFNKDMINDTEFRKINIAANVFLSLIQYSIFNPFILSTERTGASMFYKELDVNKNEILDEISRAKERDIKKITTKLLLSRYSRYPEPVKDNIYFIRDISEVIKADSYIVSEKIELHSKIIKLLQDIVGGKYIVSNESIEFVPGAKTRIMKNHKKISIQRASSSVRSLLMLNYYVLNVAQKGDILIIDEPELNLHPNNQILLGRLLTLLVNAGIKVFITTHSDYIVREIGNCIMLNNLSDEQISKIKEYTNDYKLQSNKVKVYLAENYKGKNKLSAVKVSQEQGIFTETFNEAIDRQNENQGLLYQQVIEAHRNNNNDKQ